MSFLEVRALTKTYAGTAAVNAVSFGVERGEFLAVLGPSGCGKTTTLRMLAGLAEPDAGQIVLDGRDITHLPPERRDMALVFQNYALFPHMTVHDNVAFGLRMRRIPAAEVATRVQEALSLVQMDPYARRLPGELSGGQQQRVAVARALVTRPKVLLLDEPLSNLDAKLREEMRFELKQIQRRTGLTTLFVTHDQEEALSMSDRMVVMHAGNIAQIGSPQQVYLKPATAFVASFIGRVNRFRGVVSTPASGSGVVELATGERVAVPVVDSGHPLGTPVTVLVRPERIAIAPANHAPRIDSAASVGTAAVFATVAESTFSGSATLYRCLVDGRPVFVHQMNNFDGTLLSPDTAVTLTWDPRSCYVFADDATADAAPGGAPAVAAAAGGA